MRAILLSAVMLYLFTGCAGNISNLNLANGFIKQNSEPKSCRDYINISRGDSDLLANLNLASAYRCLGDFNKSNFYFDRAEAQYKSNRESTTSIEVGKYIVSALVNDSISGYSGEVYESILINSYKALNFLSLKDFANARVEFNRALDRQRQAKIYFQEEIEEAKERVKNSKTSKSNGVKEQTLKSEEFQNRVDNYYSNLESFKAYPDFINPFTTYMAGLFFMLEGDYRKAQDLLKESYSMSESEVIQKDLELNIKALSGKKRESRYIWVIFENGDAPKLVENVINIPLFLATDNILTAGIALQNIEDGENYFEYLLVNSQKSEIISDMSRVIKSEFKKKRTQMVMRALTNTISKAILQKQAKDKAGTLGLLGASLYSILTNRADTRMWRVFPNRYEVVRVRAGEIKITTPNRVILSELTLPKDRDSIVFVKFRDRAKIEYIESIIF